MLKLIRRPRRHPVALRYERTWTRRLDGLELDDNTIGNQQVEETFTDSVPLVLDSHRNLPPKLDISQFELQAQSVLIDRLQEPGPRIRWTSMAAASNSETCSSSSF